MASFEEKLKQAQNNFKQAMDRTNGVISKSMGVNSKPTHKFHYKGFLVTIDGNLPEQDFLELRELIKTID
jgi:hypothetical protein